MSASSTLRALGMAASLCSLLTACGSTRVVTGGHLSSISVASVPALTKALAVSISQPRIIQVQVGVNGKSRDVQRVVIEAGAGYQAISRSGQLVDIVKQGHEYVRSTRASIGSCWAASSRSAPVSTSVVLPSHLSKPYTAKG